VDKLLITPNNDMNEDMKMFEILGLKNNNLFAKTYKRVSVESADSQFAPLGEKQNGHTQDTH
jgi:biotin synthase